MAADKALIAGAAKVAGAKAKLDYATTKAFTELGEDILENSQKVQADMAEAQNELNDLYDEDQSEIRTNALTLDEDVNVSIFGTDETVKKMDDAATAATEELDRVGARSFDFYDESKKGKIFELRREAQKMSSITNSELDKLNESKKMINDGFEISQFTEIKNEKYIIYSQYLKGNAKWRSGEKTKKADRFGYEIEMNGTKRFVTRSEMDDARKYYFQKDNSAEFANFLEDSTARRFKSATTNAEAEIIFNDEKKTLDSDIDNLEKFVINRMGPNTTKDGLKNRLTKKGVFDKVGYEELLKDYGGTFLREQQALHYKPPKVDKPDVDEYKNAKEFIANLAIPSAPRGGQMSNKAYFSSSQFQSDAQTAGIIFEPEMKIEGTGDDAKEVPTGNFVVAHMSNSASKQTPIRINPNEPLEAIQGKLEAIYLY